MSRYPRMASRLDLVLVTSLCSLMTGCFAAVRPEPKPDPKRVAYLGIDEAPPALEQAVALRVDPGYERVSEEEYRETARKLEAESMLDLDVARVAHALDVDVIIHGRYVRKNRRRGRVEVLMRTAATGAVVAEYVIPVRRGVMTRRGERKLDSGLRAELEALLGPPVPEPDAPAEAVAGAEASSDQALDTPRNNEEKTDARTTPAHAPAAPAAKSPDRQVKAVSKEPAAGAGAAAQSQPTAPVIRQHANGQVIDDEKPPAP